MKNDDPLDWVTQFDDPEVHSAERTQRNRGLTIGLGVLGDGGVIAAIAVLVTALTRPVVDDGGVGAEPAPTSTPTAPSIAESSTPEPSLIPDGCDELFSDSMVDTLAGVGLDLGSNWSGEPESGSADAELRMLLDDAALDCHWTTDAAASPLLLTQVAEVSSHETELATARLDELGFNQISELGGVRYVIEHRAGSEVSGESHFFREGVWFATHWSGHGQYGYTADMVNSVFS